MAPIMMGAMSMSWPRRRAQMTRGALLLLAAAVGLVAWLVWFPGTAPRQQQAIEQAADDLLAAIHSGDRAAFEASFAPRADAERVDTLWTNLRQFEIETLTPASSQSWRVVWRLPVEDAAASHLVAPELDCGWRRCRLVDIGQQPGSPTPIWLTGPVSVQREGQVAVISGIGGADWLADAVVASGHLVQTGAGGLLRPAALQVVEVPADATAFEQVLAQPILQYRAAGAITWVADSGGESPSGRPAAVRIVIQPASTQGLTVQQRQGLLLHEQVHAATAWLGAPAPGRQWVSEGLAEWVRSQHDPDLALGATGLEPAGCAWIAPADEEFAGADPLPAYQRSAAAVAAIMGRPDAAEVLVGLWRDAGPPVLMDCG